MKNFLTFPQNSESIAITMLKTLLSLMLTLLFIVFTVLSIPIYIFRVIAIQLAKYFRPDLGDILNGQSGLFTLDYFGTTAAPRANIVAVFICRGIVTCEDMKNRVMNRLIQSREKSTGRLLYEKLQQYPILWLGFSFWKKAYDTFSIDDHVYRHSGKDVLVTNDQLTSSVEKLLNTRLSKNKSPWEFHVIENYKYEETSSLSNEQQLKGKGEQHAVLIFKFHHCLADGFGITKLLTEGLFEHSTSEMKRPKVQKLKRSLQERLAYWLSFPISVVEKMSVSISHNFTSHPWKVSDKKKKWNQVYARSELIPIGLVKEIKDAFDVSFTSVLLSAISGAVEKSMRKYSGERSVMPCVSILPALGSPRNRQVLENHFTATVFELPSSNFASSVERLQTVHQNWETSRNSVTPFLVQAFSTFSGAHWMRIGGELGKNHQFPIGLTNFPFAPENELKLHDNAKIIHADTVCGGLSGDLGVAITAISYNGHVRMNIAAEEAIMTRLDAQRFVKYIREEIENLRDLMKNQPPGKKTNNNSTISE